MDEMLLKRQDFVFDTHFPNLQKDLLEHVPKFRALVQHLGGQFAQNGLCLPRSRDQIGSDQAIAEAVSTTIPPLPPVSV
jgi:hypothetical protein